MNFFSTAIRLCAGFHHYRDIRDLPTTTSIKYLLKLITLLTAVLVVSFIPATVRDSNRFSERFDVRRPDFSIQDGQIIVRSQQPAVWGDDTVRFALDTTGKITKPDPRAASGLLFMGDRYTFWVTGADRAKSSVISQTLSLRGYPDGQVNGDYIRRLVVMFLCVGLPMTWMLLVLIGMLTCLLQAYFFSVVTSAMERGTATALQLPQLLNIAIHAVTPAGVIFTVYSILLVYGWQLSFNLLSVIYLITYGIFLVGATNASRDQTHAPAQEDDDWM